MRMRPKLMFTIALILLTVTTGVFTAYMYPAAEEAAIETVVLKQGSSGTQVKTLQTKLKAWGYYTGSVDGVFGAKTKAAVIYFQKVNGLTADGIVGSATAAALGISLSSSTSSGSSYGSTDLYLLSKAVYAEARGEPYTGQVAVAAVILNRVASPDFPNTVSGVIYQPWAFTAVSDGQINLVPDSTAKSAAQDAMNGWDPTNGCLYYYNPATATSTWIRSKTVTLVIGDHYFCR